MTALPHPGTRDQHAAGEGRRWDIDGPNGVRPHRDRHVRVFCPRTEAVDRDVDAFAYAGTEIACIYTRIACIYTRTEGSERDVDI